MPRARARSFLLHIKMDSLDILQELQIIQIQTLFLLMSLSVQPHFLIQRNHSKLGQVPQVILMHLMRQRRRRNTLLLIHWIYQIHTQFPSKISLKERKPKPSHSLHSYRDTNKFPCLFSHILAPVQTPTCDLCGVIFHICLVIVQGQNPFFFFLDLICCSQNFLYIGFHDDKEYFFLSNLLA